MGDCRIGVRERSQNYVGKLSLSASEKVCSFEFYSTGELETCPENSL